MVTKVSKVSEVKDVVQKGTKNPMEAFPGIGKLAESEDWKVRKLQPPPWGRKLKRFLKA